MIGSEIIDAAVVGAVIVVGTFIAALGAVWLKRQLVRLWDHERGAS